MVLKLGNQPLVREPTLIIILCFIIENSQIQIHLKIKN